MKKSKKILLLYFMHRTIGSKTVQQSIGYEELYRHLPLSASTVRGIIQEFLELHLLRRQTHVTVMGFVLTEKGMDFGYSVFPLLANDDSADTATMIIFESQTKAKRHSLLSGAAYIQLTEHTYVLFESLSKAQKRAFASELVIEDLGASQKAISLFWLRSRFGEDTYNRREKVHKQLKLLSRKLYSTVKIRSIICADIISALTDTQAIPEKYYPHELQITNLLTSFWGA